MAAFDPVSDEHLAVLMAIGLGSLSGGFSDHTDSRMVTIAANKFLSKRNKTISDSEVPRYISELVAGGVLDKRDGEYKLIMHTVYKPRLSRDMATYVKQIGLNDTKVYLVNKILLRNNEEYSIIFNVDGKGNIQLPDGTITTETPQQLSDRLVRDRKLTDKEGKGGMLRWYVDTKYHSNVKPQTTMQVAVGNNTDFSIKNGEV